jgi:hypothetical protein
MSTDKPYDRLSIAEKEFLSAILSRTEGLPPPPPILTRQPAMTEVKPKKRCAECKRKLMLSDMTCSRCGERFCAGHRLPEEHQCWHNFREEGRKLLTAANPVVKADKMSSRI